MAWAPRGQPRASQTMKDACISVKTCRCVVELRLSEFSGQRWRLCAFPPRPRPASLSLAQACPPPRSKPEGSPPHTRWGSSKGTEGVGCSFVFAFHQSKVEPILQLLGLVPGTGCFQDLAVGAAEMGGRQEHDWGWTLHGDGHSA